MLDIIDHGSEVVPFKLLEERDEISLAPVGIDVVLVEECIADLAHRPRRLPQIPDTRSDRVEPVTAFQVEGGGFSS